MKPISYEVVKLIATLAIFTGSIHARRLTAQCSNGASVVNCSIPMQLDSGFLLLGFNPSTTVAIELLDIPGSSSFSLWQLSTLRSDLTIASKFDGTPVQPQGVSAVTGDFLRNRIYPLGSTFLRFDVASNTVEGISKNRIDLALWQPNFGWVSADGSILYALLNPMSSTTFTPSAVSMDTTTLIISEPSVIGINGQALSENYSIGPCFPSSAAEIAFCQVYDVFGGTGMMTNLSRINTVTWQIEQQIPVHADVIASSVGPDFSTIYVISTHPSVPAKSVLTAYNENLEIIWTKGIHGIPMTILTSPQILNGVVAYTVEPLTTKQFMWLVDGLTGDLRGCWDLTGRFGQRQLLELWGAIPPAPLFYDPASKVISLFGFWASGTEQSPANAIAKVDVVE